MRPAHPRSVRQSYRRTGAESSSVRQSVIPTIPTAWGAAVRGVGHAGPPASRRRRTLTTPLSRFATFRPNDIERSSTIRSIDNRPTMFYCAHVTRLWRDDRGPGAIRGPTTCGSDPTARVATLGWRTGSHEQRRPGRQRPTRLAHRDRYIRGRHRFRARACRDGAGLPQALQSRRPDDRSRGRPRNMGRAVRDRSHLASDGFSLRLTARRRIAPR